MKNIFSIIMILIGFSQINCFSQPIGFVQSECGIIQNPNYYYENYIVYPHGGGGFRLYHNGIIIYQIEDSYSVIEAEELKFIDDTTGFMTVYDTRIPRFNVYKIINNSVIYIGFAPAQLFNSFVASRHTIYLSSYPKDPGNSYLVMTKLSDLANRKELLNTDTLISDTTLHDTILGIPLCQGFNKLDYLYKDSNDTLVITILFKIDTLVYISQIQESTLRIQPNPALDYIQIVSSSIERINSILILDNFGRTKKYFNFANVSEKVLYIGDLINGMYFLVIESSDTKRVCKFIKI